MVLRCPIYRIWAAGYGIIFSLNNTEIFSDSRHFKTGQKLCRYISTKYTIEYRFKETQVFRNGILPKILGLLVGSSNILYRWHRECYIKINSVRCSLKIYSLGKQIKNVGRDDCIIALFIKFITLIDANGIIMSYGWSFVIRTNSILCKRTWIFFLHPKSVVVLYIAVWLHFPLYLTRDPPFFSLLCWKLMLLLISVREVNEINRKKRRATPRESALSPLLIWFKLFVVEAKPLKAFANFH